MAPQHGTDPASSETPVPLEGDGHELIGMIVDARYRLEATLGRGGMGLVYRATHVGMRRQVAVKILHPSLAASPEVRSRFEREALAVGKIDHPNCVATYDVGRLPDGSLYLAMELLEGRSLADVLEQEGQLPPGRALHILGHVLRGLGAVHTAGLIHRDIKPENIFLIRHGDDLDFAKILDFGIAKPMTGELTDDGVRLTQAGMAFGTPIYMAPEQALGNPMDGRADLYAAAVIGYEMLCGQPPFYSEDKLEVMSMHTAKPVPPMRQRLIKRGAPVPSTIEKLILRGLTKKPGDRYATAEVFLAAVEAALHTPDGGATDLNFVRPDSETGAHSLIDADGELRMEDEDQSASIHDAIEEALAIAPASTVPARTSTPGRGVPSGTKHDSGVVGRLGTKLGVQPPQVAAGDPRGRAAGGVGIGLPYTGPAGQPIFGLTPEQRLAKRPRRKLWPYALILAAAVGGGVAVAIWTTPNGDDGRTPSAIARSAAHELAGGHVDRALAILNKDPAAIANDPDAQRVLGHAHASIHDRTDSLAALDAYRKALTDDPTLEQDKELRSDLRAMAADKDPEVVMNAFDLWVGHTADPEAKPALFNAAVSDDVERRHAAAPVVERYKLGDHVDWVQAYAHDLEQEETCAQRKEAVAKLRALGDPRGIAPLERAIEKRVGKYHPNKCLEDDANIAIGYLKGLHKQ